MSPLLPTQTMICRRPPRSSSSNLAQTQLLQRELLLLRQPLGSSSKVEQEKMLPTPFSLGARIQTTRYTSLRCIDSWYCIKGLLLELFVAPF